MTQIIIDVAKKQKLQLKVKNIDRIIFVFMILSCWLAAYKNPNILDIIISIVGPTGAIITLLLPMYALHKIPALSPYRNKISNVFVTIIGIITVSAILYSFV